jgi:hypothetical protein
MSIGAGSWSRWTKSSTFPRRGTNCGRNSSGIKEPWSQSAFHSMLYNFAVASPSSASAFKIKAEDIPKNPPDSMTTAGRCQRVNP